jgi:hypothetical protein
MRLKQRRPALILPVLAMLPLLGSPFQSQPEGLQAKAAARETLDYDLEWRLVSAGHAKLTKSGREMRLHLESTGLVSRLFHVNDDYLAQSTENDCAVRTLMRAREGSRDRETQVDYDYSQHKVFFHERDLVKNNIVSKEIAVPDCANDIIGGLYRLRTLSLEPGKSVFLPISDGRKSVDMKIECQRREEIRTPLGPRKTLLYEIFAFNDVLYKRPGHVHIWLSDDDRHVPVQIEIRLQFTIGTITLRLAKDERS